MTIVTFGDMAQLQALRRDGAAMKSELSRLTSELSTGRVADLGRALGGDFSTIADITRSLRLNNSFSASVKDAAFAAAGRQTSLGRLAAELGAVAPGVLAVTGAGSLNDLHLRLAGGTDRFQQAVNVLNTQLAGQSLFSGDAPDLQPLISGDVMMAELRNLVATAPDAATMVADVTAWFTDAVGGYETTAWQGGTGQPPAVLLSEGQAANPGITALDPAIRSSLAGLAILALASERSVPLPESEQRALATAGALQVQRGETALIGTRARLGAEEARIEEARVTAEATRAGLQIEFGRLVEADPYDTATELETVNTRLETLYLLTARMSRLSLTEFLR